jgi:hypothetical protein
VSQLDATQPTGAVAAAPPHVVALSRAVTVVRFLRPFWPHLLGVLAFAWGMVFVAWILLPSSRIVEVEIPLGTADSVARGEAVETLPRDLLLRRGDTLVLANYDDQPHRIGAIWAEPGRSTRTIVDRNLQNSGSVFCTFHPGGAIGVSPQSRPSITQTTLPTLMIFFPLAAATVLTLSITKRLSDA